MIDLAYELRRCKECSCSRCHMYATPECYIELAIRELNQNRQALDAFETYLKFVKGEANDNQ